MKVDIEKDKNLFCIDNFQSKKLLITGRIQNPIKQESYVTLFNKGKAHRKKDLKATHRVLEKNIDSNWGAYQLERDRISANFQGNPLWPYNVLKKYQNIIKHFDLLPQLTQNICLIPTLEKINNDLESIKLKNNKFKFYELKVDEKISEKEYVNMFIDQNLLPMATEKNRDSIHDWSYHFLTMLFPKYLELVQDCLRGIRNNLPHKNELNLYSWNYYGHTVDFEGKMRGIEKTCEMTCHDAIYRQMAISLDVATAKPIQLLLLSNSEPKKSLKNELRSIEVFFQVFCQKSFDKVIWQNLSRKRISIDFNKISENSNSIRLDVISYFESELQKLNTQLFL